MPFDANTGQHARETGVLIHKKLKTRVNKHNIQIETDSDEMTEKRRWNSGDG